VRLVLQGQYRRNASCFKRVLSLLHTRTLAVLKHLLILATGRAGIKSHSRSLSRRELKNAVDEIGGRLPAGVEWRTTYVTNRLQVQLLAEATIARLAASTSHGCMR